MGLDSPRGGRFGRAHEDKGLRSVIEQQANLPDAVVPQPAEGLDLMGEYEGSGFKEKPYLARRADGQVVQLSRLLYLVAEAVDGERDFEEIAGRVTQGFGRTVSADNIRYLVDNKLRPLGMVAAADGSSPKLERATPLFMLRYRVGLVPAGIVRAITAVFWPLFLPPVVVGVLAGIVSFDLWLFFVHGGLGSAVRETIYQPTLFATLGFVVSVVAVALHECGHATACRYGGAKPGVLGVGIYIVWLVFYSDVTDSYRLGKIGRLRTDLGGVYFETVLTLALIGAYFVTGFEPLLVLIVLIQIGLLDEFAPFFRFDGYYVISDLTGVPDLFGRIKPILKTLIPGREADRRVTELKPWVRVVVTIWVLTVVPFLVSVLAILAFYAPKIIATAWDSFLVHSDKLSSAFEAGKMLEVMLAFSDIVFLLIPVAGVILLLSIVGGRLGTAAWRASVGKPRLRAGFMAALVVAGGLVLALWWPDLGLQERVRQAASTGTPNGGAAMSEVPADQPAPRHDEDLAHPMERGQDGSSSAEPAARSSAVPEPAGAAKCKGGPEECLRQFVAEIAPEAKYAGGRIDTNAGGFGRNRNVLYFVDHTMEPCEYRKLESEASGEINSYAAIVAAEGSLTTERSDCVPDS